MKKNRVLGRGLPFIITAASAGTIIEWYDFFIFGSLATIISTEFFPAHNPAASFLATLAAFSAGLLVRPAGALFFGGVGDRIGRKHTFMITLAIMGISTVGIGVVPGYQAIGIASPVIVLMLRLMQGLALGGEYGGAATYVAEHAPAERKGFFTSFIQTTSGLAFILSIAVILAIKSTMAEKNWLAWGWRLPFILSFVLVGVSLYIRNKMAESPLFAEARAVGKISKNPLRESFTRKDNLKTILLAFFGLTFGGGAIGWITFYAQSFMLKTLMIDFQQANSIIIIGILAGVPFFVLFGWLSDKIGRKWIMIAGMFLGVLCFRPVFDQMHSIADKEMLAITNSFVDEQRTLSASGDSVSILQETISYADGSKAVKSTKTNVSASRRMHEETTSIVLTDGQKWRFIALIFCLQVIFTLAYAPLAAYMVELFPVQIRYTSLSFPYHFGFGIFGGLAPYFATYFVWKASLAGRPDFYLAGLNYPIVLTAISVVIGTLYLRENGGKTLGIPVSSSRLNPVRKWLGVIWIALAVVGFWYGIIEFGGPRIFSSSLDDQIFGLLLACIITPVFSFGLFIFGRYALKGEYNY